MSIDQITHIEVEELAKVKQALGTEVLVEVHHRRTYYHGDPLTRESSTTSDRVEVKRGILTEATDEGLTIGQNNGDHYHIYADNREGSELISTDERMITLLCQGERVLFERYYDTLPEGVSHKLKKPGD